MTGALDPIQSISTLPAGFDGRSHCADIHVHPTGKFVYGSIAATIALPSLPLTRPPAS
ncbi:MAG: beta-propeller fold lactonase family protein [Caldilineaceae bacterium]